MHRLAGIYPGAAVIGDVRSFLRRERCWLVAALFAVVAVTAVSAQQPEPAPASPPPTTWQYGGFVDVGYLLDFNHPANDLFRTRGTTPRVDVLTVSMADIYLQKSPTTTSRWGAQLTLQTGEDSKVFGFSATAPNLAGADGLRNLGPTNVSYLAPIGKGLTIQGGIFNSFVGYDSLYAKDNFNYTRPWGADFTPYLMLGVNASYPINDKVTVAGFLVNGYWHLADANAVPSWGGQVAYKPRPQWTVKQTVLVGPHQSDTAFEFWRFLSDSTAEWKRDPLTIAFEYTAATEKVATPAQPRATWMSAQLPAHWQVSKRWAIALRPEVAWDSDGRWTGFPQTVKAMTSTLEYRYPIRKVNNILRLEYRVDDSRGPGGGFFRGAWLGPNTVGLTPTQHLLVFGAIFTYDGQFARK